MQDAPLTFRMQVDRGELIRVRLRLFMGTPAGIVFGLLCAVGLAAALALAWSSRSWIAPLAMLVLWLAVLSRTFGRVLTSISAPPKVGASLGTIQVCSPKGISATGAADAWMPWSAIKRWMEIPEGFVLVSSRGSVFISCRSFDGLHSVVRFRDLLRQQAAPR